MQYGGLPDFDRCTASPSLLSVCWQAHRGYPFCSRQSEADNQQSEADYPNRRQSGTTLQVDKIPVFIRTQMAVE